MVVGNHCPNLGKSMNMQHRGGKVYHQVKFRMNVLSVLGFTGAVRFLVMDLAVVVWQELH